MYIIEDVVLEENKITRITIESLNRPRFVTIYDKDSIDRIYGYCVKLLEYSMTKHDSKEMAYAINLDDLNLIGAVFGTSRSVNIASLIDVVNNTSCIFLVIHNHPSDKPFSYRDLFTFFSVPNMKILIVLGNKGSVYTIEKTDNELISDNYKYIRVILIRYRNNEVSFAEVINQLEAFGVMYTFA